MKLTAEAIFDIADSYHQIYQVLNAEYFIESDWILLIYCLNEQPILLDYFYVLGVGPKICAHHQTMKELLLELSRLSDVKADICQVLNGLAVYCIIGEPGNEVEEKCEKVLVMVFARVIGRLGLPGREEN
jgi:hypothetical protein